MESKKQNKKDTKQNGNTVINTGNTQVVTTGEEARGRKEIPREIKRNKLPVAK